MKKFNIEDHDFQGISIKDNCAIKLKYIIEFSQSL